MPLWSFWRHGRSCVISRNGKDEMMQGDPAIRTLDPYSLCCLCWHPYSLRHLRILCILPTTDSRISVLYGYCVHNVCILYPYSLCWLGGDPHPNLVSGESTDAVHIIRMPEETVRSQYELTLSAAYVKHEITFIIGLRIAADWGGNPQTQYGYSRYTVRIPCASCRIEHPPQYAASVRRYEKGLKHGMFMVYSKQVRQHIG